MSDDDTALREQLRKYAAVLRTGQYLLPATGVTHETRIALESGVWNAIADDLEAMLDRTGSTS
jgi:hypothetical protein